MHRSKEGRGRSPSAAPVPSLRAAALFVALAVAAPVAFCLLVPGQPKNLTRSPGLDGRPSGSPGGKFCAFASARGGPVGIYVLELDTLAVRPLVVPRTAGEFCDQPAWSPKGDIIAFASNMGGRGRPDIFVVRPDGTGLRPVVEGPATDWMPALSPDGREVLFASDRGGGSAIYRASVEGGGEPTLVARDAWDPAWSPRGDLIAYTAVRGGKVGVYVAKPDGSDERLVCEGGREPCFSPDGRLLAFVKGRGRESAIWVAPVGGGGPGRPLISLGVPLSSPDWPAPDMLLFCAELGGDLDVWEVRLSRERPEAKISSPGKGEVVRGAVEIRGTAWAPRGALRSWRLELFPLGRPGRAILLAEGTKGVSDGLLAQWDTGGLSGTFSLRLTVEDADGDTASDEVRVHVFGAYGVEYVEATVPSTMTAGAAHKVSVRMRNLGSMTWRAKGPYAVVLRYRWLDRGGATVAGGVVGPLPEDVPMGAEVEVKGEVVAPRRPGSYVLEFDLAQGGAILFSEQGCPPLRTEVAVVVPYAARVVSCDLPHVLAPSQIYSAGVSVRNDGAEGWSGLALSYVWLDPEGRELEVEPLKAPIEGPVGPGEAARVVLPVRTPSEAGRFVLQFRLVGPRGEVLVADAGRAEVEVRRPYSASLRLAWLPLRIEPGGRTRVDVEVRNEGALLLPSSGPGRVGLRVVFLDRKSGAEASEGVFTPLPEDVRPGGMVMVRAAAVAPRRPGDYLLRVELRKADGTALGARAEAVVSVARRALEVEWELLSSPPEMVVGQPAVVELEVRNLGSMRWPSGGPRRVVVRPRFLDEEGREVGSATQVASLPCDVGCGESAKLRMEVVAPERPGRFLLEFDLEQEGVGPFSRFGCETLRVPVRVLPLYAVAYLGHDTPAVLVAGQVYTVRLRLRNEGALVWEPSGPGAVCLSYRILDEQGKAVVPMGGSAPLPREVRMGEEVEVIASLRAPDRPGRYVVVWDLLHGGEVWFSEKGAEPLEVEVEVR